MGCLYRLTFPSGKAYIGICATTAQRRFAEHVYNAKRGLGRGVNRAMRKYGAETVKVETLVIADDWEYLCALERKAIAAYGTKGPGGYNMTDGGDGALGYRHTQESLRKMGDVHRGKAHNSMPHTAEAKAKMSASQTARFKREAMPAETRAKIGAASRGNKHAAGRKLTDEHKQRISQANKGKVWTDESRARLSIAATKREEAKRAERGQQWTQSNL